MYIHHTHTIYTPNTLNTPGYRYRRNGYLLGAGTPSGLDSDPPVCGLVPGHAYAVLRVEEASDLRGNHQLVQVRVYIPW